MKNIFNMALLFGVCQSVKINSDPIESSAGGPVKETSLPFGDYFHAHYDEFPGTKGFAPEYKRDIPVQF